MIATPRWHSSAIQDLESGHQWYEEREPGLGSGLARELDRVVREALAHPHAPRKYEHSQLPTEPWVRTIQLKRFSEYGFVYTIVDETLWIVAIVHAKRRPGYWISRLDDLPRP